MTGKLKAVRKSHKTALINIRKDKNRGKADVKWVKENFKGTGHKLGKAKLYEGLHGMVGKKYIK
jgi:hypothetical protein